MTTYHRKLYYFIFALGFYFVWFLFKLGGNPDLTKAIISTAIDVLFSLFTLWLTVEWLIPRYVYPEKYARFCGIFLMLVFFSGSLIILAQLKLFGNSIFAYRENMAKHREHFFYWFWSDLIFGSYFLIAFISLTGCAFRLALNQAINAKKMETLEKEKAIAALEVLRQQINPHFLFNALNTVYYTIDKSNIAARKILEQFSFLLRYQLYECNIPVVPIEKEMKFLSSYIDVQRQRFSEKFTMECRGFADVSGFEIAPYLLAPLVENCFKHVSALPGKDQYVRIACAMENNWFRFHAENSISPQHQQEKGGIGLMNMRKRLALTYPDHHFLTIDRTAGHFSVTLQIGIL